MLKLLRITKNRFIELLVNDDGKLSRTQVTIWLVFLQTFSLIWLEVIYGNILTTNILLVLGGLHLFSLVDRMDVKYFQFKSGNTSLEVKEDDK
jgi:hypothetical protein